MLERIDYIERNGAAIILRVFGEDSIVELPSQVDGLPVRELADHCFAAEPSCRYGKHEIRSWWRREAGMSGEVPAVCGEQIREIILSDPLETIGAYAFYGCQNLRSLYFNPGLKRLASGILVACNAVREIHFTVSDPLQTPELLTEIMAELTYELDIILENERGEELLHVTFPEYYEEARENTPARIISTIYHGTGYMYRQCFHEKKLDLTQYDSLFYLTSVQELPSTTLRVACNRLKSPAGLSETAREQYLSWLREERTETSKWVLNDEREDLLETLGNMGYFSPDLLDYFLEQAASGKRPEAVSYLMDYRRSHFQTGRRRKYDL